MRYTKPTNRRAGFIAEARVRMQPVVAKLASMGARCMQQVYSNDEYNNVTIIERWWIPAGPRSCCVLVSATKDGWDVYAPVTRSGNVEETLAALESVVQ